MDPASPTRRRYSIHFVFGTRRHILPTFVPRFSISFCTLRPHSRLLATKICKRAHNHLCSSVRSGGSDRVAPSHSSFQQSRLCHSICFLYRLSTNLQSLRLRVPHTSSLNMSGISTSYVPSLSRIYKKKPHHPEHIKTRSKAHPCFQPWQSQAK